MQPFGFEQDYGQGTVDNIKHEHDPRIEIGLGQGQGATHENIFEEQDISMTNRAKSRPLNEYLAMDNYLKTAAQVMRLTNPAGTDCEQTHG